MNDQLRAQELETQRQLLEQLRLTHARVLDLTEFELQRRWEIQPDPLVLPFGSGQQGERMIEGDQLRRFYGVTILNPSAMTILFAPDGKPSTSGLHCPPKSGIVWPSVFAHLGVGVAGADLEHAAESIVVLRMWYPPAQPDVFAYS